MSKFRLSNALMLSIVSVVMLAGCSQSTTHRLVGSWIGEPVANGDYETDLADVEVSITIEFNRDHSANMSLGGGESPLVGTWKVLDSDGNLARLEISTTNSTMKATDDREMEIRVFQIQFIEPGDEGEPHQFTLSEEGADPKFGSLRFTRQPD